MEIVSRNPREAGVHPFNTSLRIADEYCVNGFAGHERELLQLFLVQLLVGNVACYGLEPAYERRTEFIEDDAHGLPEPALFAAACYNREFEVRAQRFLS